MDFHVYFFAALRLIINTVGKVKITPPAGAINFFSVLVLYKKQQSMLLFYRKNYRILYIGLSIKIHAF
jgi:hypothetical protein